MLNTKKILTKIISIIGVDYYVMRSYTLGNSFSITARPYTRIGIFVPTWLNVNSIKYKAGVVSVPANAASVKLTAITQDGGTNVTSATIDSHLILIRVLN